MICKNILAFLIMTRRPQSTLLFQVFWVIILKGLLGDCLFTDLQKKSYSIPVSGIVIHCMNHSTFHRGNLITMMRNMGMLEFPATDFIDYLRTKTNQ